MDTETAKLAISGHQKITKRRHALVSKRDLDELKQYNWLFHEGQGYAYRWVVEDGQRKMVYLHRHVLGLEFGDGQVADHINGDKLDCRRDNLRVLTTSQNAQNIRRKVEATSRFRGVHLAGSRWVATVSHQGRTHYLGRFFSEVQAAEAAEAKRQELLPFAEPDPELSKVKDLDLQLRFPMAIS